MLFFFPCTQIRSTQTAVHTFLLQMWVGQNLHVDSVVKGRGGGLVHAKLKG